MQVGEDGVQVQLFTEQDKVGLKLAPAHSCHLGEVGGENVKGRVEKINVIGLPLGYVSLSSSIQCCSVGLDFYVALCSRVLSSDQLYIASSRLGVGSKNIVHGRKLSHQPLRC